ncbi:MAG: folate-binding protein [Gammaproteobacteria bacterium]|nr:folate-binding protein [Gammaproteobacteria bacterium]
MRIASLDEYGVLSLAGADRQSFLQGQITQDLLRLDAGDSPLAGWCNPKGRLLAVGQLIGGPDEILWLLPKELVPAAAARLKMFVLRAAVDLSVAPLSVFGVFDAPETCRVGPLTLQPDQQVITDDGAILARVAGDASRAWLLAADPDALPELQDTVTGDPEWAAADVAAGLPGICAATAETFVPQMVNLDLLDGISFTKGCYVGQEVVARTQNLGRIKRRMFRYRASASAAPGAALLDPDGDTVGKIVRCAAGPDGPELLAVVQLGAVGRPLSLASDTAPLVPLRLPYEVPAAT